MKKKKLMSLFVVFLICVIIISCSTSEEEDNNTTSVPYVYTGNYNMIKVPVPQGGIIFPTGYDDDDTAMVDSTFYLGETHVIYGLYQTVADWATNKKEGAKYGKIYWKEHQYLSNNDMKYPMCSVSFSEIMVWCNAYTEWYNEKYGTNFTPVYTEPSNVPIRDAKNAYNIMTPSSAERFFNEYYAYLKAHPLIENYLNGMETTGTGFRLPTSKEWELAARWRGTDNTNTVTKIINDVDFSIYPIKFTKGNSASNANDNIINLNETHQYAVFEYNSKGKLALPKTKKPNTLGLYDMSGNLREYVYHKVLYLDVPSKYDVWDKVISRDPYPFSLTKGGYFEDTYATLAIGSEGVYVDSFAYNYYYGFRLARNGD